MHTGSTTIFGENDQTAKADYGKAELSLVPRRIIWDIAAIRMYGNEKYHDPDNWKNVEPERYRNAAFRHFLAYLDDPHGVDKESGLPHLWHLDCNLAFLCEIEDMYLSKSDEVKEQLHKEFDGCTSWVTNGDGTITAKLTDARKEFVDEWKRKHGEAKILGKVTGTNEDGTITAKLTDAGKAFVDEWKGKYEKALKENFLENTEAEPGWTKWEYANRDSEAEFIRYRCITDKPYPDFMLFQYGDWDFESGEIIPRKE